ncbi:hypothetical protein AAFF_G00038100 [Aldrovandia affinis]|uniref:Uncharacterized protein n=1 Tax=Aldrovandia affinis TaxID=143900 RepID=A0AAD7T5F4_9TELE|nr:hypothetical protein AAFF_G00038100 [Aldrovandia affinis]
MLNRRTARLVLLGVTFVVVCFTLLTEGFETTTRRHVSRATVYEVQRTHRRAGSKYQRAPVDVRVHHARWSATVKPRLKRKPQKPRHVGKVAKQTTNAMGMGVELNGPNVCGNRCCAGWTVTPKTKKCTKREF